MKKPERQRLILTLIDTQPVASQEDLRLLLEARGLTVTQATLSRDLRELQVVRASGPDGARYRAAAQLGDDPKVLLEALLPQFFSSMDGVGELIVVRTLAGGAQPVAEGIDGQEWPEVLGTIGGENTILIICRSAAARLDVTQRLQHLADAP